MEIRKSCHQEYKLTPTWQLLTVTRIKIIHGNINNKETNQSINNNDTDRVKTKA